MRRYLYGNDLISMTSGGTDSYYHYDGLGTTTDVPSALGVPQWSYDYEPFGTNRTSLKVDPLAPENAMRFTGEYLDPSGLYHLRARQFDPALGRFLQVDPVLGELRDVSVSAYAYAKNLPTTYTDPSGRTPWCAKPDGGFYPPSPVLGEPEPPKVSPDAQVPSPSPSSTPSGSDGYWGCMGKCLISPIPSVGCGAAVAACLGGPKVPLWVLITCATAVGCGAIIVTVCHFECT